MAHERAPSGGDDDAFLRALGERVRTLRAQRRVTRRALASASGLSERYIAQVESGQGNVSVVLLRHLAGALDVPLERLFAGAADEPESLTHALALLRRLDPGRLHAAHALLAERFGSPDGAERRGRIALIGLRGAGKTTLGARLAARLGVPFVELDREVERAAGIPLATLFELSGQSGFRRLERAALDEVLATRERFVLATGGSLVVEPDTFARLLDACFTVWLRAAPEDHMQRVIAQGDLRPIAGHASAMDDLKQLLAERDALYRRADISLDTSSGTVEETEDALAAALGA